MKKKLKLVFGYVFGLAVLGIILYLGGTSAVELAISPNLGFLSLSLLANVAVFAVGSFRWGYITNNIYGKKVISYPRYFSYFVSSRFLGQYISQAGGDFVFKPGMLKQIDGISIKYGLSSIIIEKLYDILFIGILLIPSILYLLNTIDELLLFMIACLITLFFFLMLLFQTEKLIKLLTLGVKFFSVILQKIPIINAKFQGKFNLQIDNLQRLKILGKKTIIIVFLLTILRFILLISRLFWLSQSLELGIPVHLFLVGVPIAQMALAFAITPGALGFLEGGWYAILTSSGIGEVERSAFLIGQRVYFSLFIGLIFILTYLIFGVSQLNKFKKYEKPT